MAYRSNLRSIGLGTTALALVMSMGSAVAQSVPATPASSGAGETVTVTGSLLGTNFNAPTPVTTVGSQTIDTRAVTGIGTVVSELPFAQAGDGLVKNTSGVNSVAESFPNLRGLGANRTLVLVDGQRPTPENVTNNFDTNLIPSSLIQRFDVVTTGASASYGSDAVAGVVNFVLKDHFEGFTGTLQYGISQRGDNDQPFGSFAYGTDFLGGRGHFIIGGEATGNSDAVTSLKRDWGKLEPGEVALTTARPAGTPAGIFTNHAEFSAFTPGGLITTGALKGIAFDANGSPYNFPFGSVVGTNMMIGTGNFGNSDLHRALAPPYSREVALTRVEYDITPEINAFVTVNYGVFQSDAKSTGAPLPITFVISRNNPYIPASVAAAMDTNHLSTITVAKQSLIGIGNQANDSNTLLQSMFGVKGRVFDDWSWDIQGNTGLSNRVQGFVNVPDDANAYAAAAAVAGPNGTPVCGPIASNATINSQAADLKTHLLAVQSPGCVPINIFGSQPLNSAALNYIYNPTDANGVYGGKDQGTAKIRQTMFEANLRGSPFSLPAGDVDTAFGANFRTNSYRQRGTPNATVGAYDSLNPNTFSISQSVWEIFTEVGVPVLRDLPFAKAVDFSAAARYTDYSISGGATTWKFGATWDIDDMWRLRATRSQDIRAPNFNDLAQVSVNSASNVTNPLNGDTARIATIQTTGNPALKPEAAKNISVGAVFNSGFDCLPGFRASVDYFRINISGVIATVAVQDVVNRCLLQNLGDYCNQVVFTGSNINNTFGIAGINLSPANLNNQIQDGVDIDLNENLPLDDYGLPGTVNWSAVGTYNNQQRTIQTLTGGAISNVNFADTATAPRWAVNTTLGYQLERLGGSLQMRYYSPLEFSATNVGPGQAGYSPLLSTSVNRNIWPAAVTFNLHLSYELFPKTSNDSLQLFLNVDNLLDKDPPLIWQTVGNYDVMGRYFRVGLRYNTD